MTPASPLCKTVLALWLCTSMAASAVLAGQPPDESVDQPAEPPETAQSDADEGDGSLQDEQEQIAQRYDRFEKTLLQMAEYLRKTDPDQADLLVRTISRSKEERIGRRMEEIAELLREDSPRYGDAIDRQTALLDRLESLLTLLQSEDRKSAIEKEKKRIQDLLKNVDRIIGKEKDVRAGTERGGDPERLADSQKDVSDETGRIVDKIDEQDAKRNGNEGDGSQEGGQPDGESGKSDEKESDQEEDARNGEGRDKETDGQGNPSGREGGDQDSQPGEGGEGQQNGQQGQQGQQGQKGQQGQQGQGGQQAQPSERKQTPGRQELEKARREMERAIEQLKQRNRRGASEKQDEALTELQKAKEKLEEILRQLREEERQILLAALEARFQHMLARQTMVHNGTVGLSETPEDQWASRHRSRAVELSRKEREIVLEADKAMALLKEDGSSVAFPEALGQLRQDMETIAGRLERSQVGELTQAIEEDVIAALKEMIEAFHKEMEESRKRQQQQSGQQGRPEDPSLVDQLAELKMLRSLQMRINRRTQRLGELIDGDQATDPDLVEQLRQLSDRQARLQEAAYDLATGRNR